MKTVIGAVVGVQFGTKDLPLILDAFEVVEFADGRLVPDATSYDIKIFDLLAPYVRSVRSSVLVSGKLRAHQQCCEE